MFHSMRNNRTRNSIGLHPLTRLILHHPLQKRVEIGVVIHLSHIKTLRQAVYLPITLQRMDLPLRLHCLLMNTLHTLLR